MKRVIVAGVVLALGGCAQLAPENKAAEAQATEVSAGSGTMTTMSIDTTVVEANGAFRIQLSGTGLPAGVHGMHVHEVGRCDGPSFTSSGPHWNPTAKKHGKDNPAGPHLGDLPNLVVEADGRGSAEFVIENAAGGRSASGLLDDEDGASLLIHATADDYRTDPSGASGDRIACTVLKPPK